MVRLYHLLVWLLIFLNIWFLDIAGKMHIYFYASEWIAFLLIIEIIIVPFFLVIIQHCLVVSPNI